VLVPILLLLVFVGAFVERHLFADLLIMVAVAAVGLALSHFRWPRAPMLIGLVLGALAENRLFLSTDAYGTAWLLRPGVLVIAGVIAASFVYPVLRHQRAPHRADGAQKESPSALGHAELAFVVVLLLITVGALVLTASFAGRAALFPRLVLGVTAALLSSIVIRDLIRGRGRMPLATPASDRISFHAVGFVPVFVLLIWALGFTPGAPVAVLIYLIAGGRERPRTIAAVTLVVFLLIEVIMVRLLQQPFPVGALLAWAGVGA
jgi:hypothetical protein